MAYLLCSCHSPVGQVLDNGLALGSWITGLVSQALCLGLCLVISRYFILMCNICTRCLYFILYCIGIFLLISSVRTTKLLS